MKKLLIALVGVCVVFIAWKTFSTLPAQGFWHASLEAPAGKVAFDYHILPMRSGMDAWVSISGAPERAMDKLDMQRKRIRFDLPVGDQVYHLDGTVVKRAIDGTWSRDDGATGSWHAQRYSVKRG